MDKIRIGIVGLGHRGRAMVRIAAESFECTELVAACDLDPLLWSETQWLQDKPMQELFPETVFYTDYDEMLAKHELDIIMVETGADVHANFCIKALNKGINVFSDIPSVASLDEAARLWKAEQESTARLMTGANPNEWGFINALADFYQKGFLGEPYYMEAEYIHATRLKPGEVNQLTVHSPWRKRLKPISYCTHSLGPLLRIMKEDLRYAICVGTGKHIRKDAEKDDMQAALFQTESGVTIRLLRNGACKAFFGHHSYRVFGTKGYFERIDSRGKTPPVVRLMSEELYACRDLTEFPIDTMPNEYAGNASAQGHGGVDYALLDHMFSAFLRGDKEFPISLREGLRMTLPGIYAVKSCQLGGQKLTIHYPWEAEFAADIPFVDDVK